MKKILIFVYRNSLGPVGGPLGYLNTLNNEDIKQLKSKLIFLENDIKYKNETILLQNKGKILAKLLREKLYFLKVLLYGKRSVEIESNQYDIIHFHSTLELYKHRKSIKSFKGEVVLTSHSPIILSKEIMNNASIWERILFYPLYVALRIVDYNAFKLSDYIVFPCEEAEEPYVNSWRGFSKFKSKNSNKFKYLLTGTDRAVSKSGLMEIRKKYGIPADAFVISYVGRHNEIKGYDKLKKLGEKILSMHDNIYFLIAGKEEPIKGLDHKRWIEIGWTNDPHSIVNAANLFILPNRETYFDLVLLEVLSLGQLVLATNTGGNKYFNDKKYEGIFLYDDLDEAYMKIINIMNLEENEISILKEKNKKVYEEQFNSKIFYENYIRLMYSIGEKDFEIRKL